MIVYNSPYQAEPLITLVARIYGHIPRGTQPSHRQYMYLQRAMCQYKIARVLRQIPADIEPSHLRDVHGGCKSATSRKCGRSCYIDRVHDITLKSDLQSQNISKVRHCRHVQCHHAVLMVCIIKRTRPQAADDFCALVSIPGGWKATPDSRARVGESAF